MIELFVSRGPDLEDGDDQEDTNGIDAATFRDMQDDLADRLGIIRTDVAGSVDGVRRPTSVLLK